MDTNETPQTDPLVAEAVGDAPRHHRRGGGRAGNARRSGPAIKQTPWTDIINTDRPTEPIPAEGVEAIHDGAMRILEEIGIQFLNADAVDILRKAGCRVDGENVKMDRTFVMEMVRKAPSEFTITPRNPDRKLTIGGRHMVFGNISSPPNCSDIDRGRRTGNHAD